jgi:16S rRNA processing protein RimM
MEELVAIVRIVRTRALKGEVVAEVLTDFPERFEGLTAVTAVHPSGEQSELIIEKFWFQNGRVILKFAGYDSIETSETLRDVEICVAESAAVELKADEYFDWQLTGCTIETLDGEKVGQVTGLMRTGGTELLTVEGPGRDHLIPFAASICVEVDIDGKRIVIDPPDGLLDF